LNSGDNVEHASEVITTLSVSSSTLTFIQILLVVCWGSKVKEGAKFSYLEDKGQQ